MTAFLDRIRYWLGKREPQPDMRWEDPVTGMRANIPFPGALRGPIIRVPVVDSPTKTQGLDYLADFGPNVPQETHWAAARKKSCVTFENGHMKLDVSGLLATPEGREQVRRACASAPVKATPNVPVEDLGGKPVYFEDGQPVYPGREKAP